MSAMDYGLTPKVTTYAVIMACGENFGRQV